MSTRTTTHATGLTGDARPGSYVGDRGPIRSELLGPDRLQARAAEIARASARVAFASGRQLLDHIERDSRVLRAARRQLAAAYADREPLTGAAEWLLDNFHIITEALREVRTDLPFGYY